jgi:hypothetical protein
MLQYNRRMERLRRLWLQAQRFDDAAASALVAATGSTACRLEP